MSNKVIILGGGVAGMSAAHELIERGFQVEVYELKGIPGGKARSIDSGPRAAGGAPALPGEHGFRFFPRFYQHVTDTMKRIPVDGAPGARTAYDNLVQTSRIGVFRHGKPEITSLCRFPRSLADLVVLLKDMYCAPELGLSEEDVEFFGQRMWQIITSCDERRAEDYERIAWWDFVGAANRDEAYQTLLARGLTRSLVAAKAEYCNTRTGGDVLVQLMFDIAEPGVSSDRVLNAPTNQAWLIPWCSYLEGRGVKFFFNAAVEAIHLTPAGDAVRSVTVARDGQTLEASGDYYVAALPVERMADLVAQFPAELVESDADLRGILQLGRNVAWMNGLQFYLTEDVGLAHGHNLFIDSPWALTAISQKQFWGDVDLSRYADGQVKGILSVDISDWGIYVNPKTGAIEVASNPHNVDSLGRYNRKHAFECTPHEVQEEVWKELEGSVNVGGQVVLKREYVHSWFMDPDIVDRQFVRWLIDKGEVTVDEVAHHFSEAAGVAGDRLDEFLEQGVLQAARDGDRLIYRALNAPLVRWIMAEGQVSLAQVADYLHVSEAEAQALLDTLQKQGLVHRRHAPATHEFLTANQQVAPAPDQATHKFVTSGQGVAAGQVWYESGLRVERDRDFEPLLVNMVNSWHMRPEAFTRFPNLFLASDYVRTNTNLATMEGANEAARRAVNCILDAAGSKAPYCRIWNLHEPFIFKLWRWHDKRRYDQGLPWHEDMPWLIRAVQSVMITLRNVKSALARLFK